MPRNNKTNRPLGFSGYYVEIPDGGDVMRGYRKIKKWIKNDRFVEECRDRQYYQKPSFKKREVEKTEEEVKVIEDDYSEYTDEQAKDLREIDEAIEEI